MVVKDAYFAFSVLGFFAVAGVIYALRLAAGRGFARSERVGRMGGTPLIGREMMDYTYWAIEPIVRFLAWLGITPNHLTWSALVFGLGAGVALGFGLFGLATMLATFSTVGDILDGQVARLTNTGSNKGELLDAAVDRYTEFAFLAGLAIYFRDTVWILCLILGSMLASFMVSYATAKAEALHIAPPRGLMRRHERGTYLIAGVGFSSMFGGYLHERFPDLPWYSFTIFALICVAVIGNVAAVTRFVKIGRALR